MAIIDKLKGAIRRMGATTGMAHEFKDIFEVGGVPAFNQFYYFGIFPWHYVYKGFYSPWHKVAAPTIAAPYASRELFRLNMAKACCAELAGLLWGEKATVNVNLKGFTPTDEEPVDKAQRFIDSVLNANNFDVKMQEAIEQALALGGEAIKVWYEERHDADGNAIPGSGEIKIGWCMADQFVPTEWTNAEISAGVFISRIARDGYYYTRLEWHKWDGDTYVVSNELFRSDMKKKGAEESQDILGFRYPLATIYPFLNEETPIQGLEKSLFSYFRPPVANNIDDNSPLGVSVYANAMDTLRALDICYDSFVREFRLGKKRIIVPDRCLRTIVDPSTGVARRYFDANDEAYEAMATDDAGDLKIHDNSVELRVEEHVAAMNTLLQILCLQLGFSASTFSFSVKDGLKTATEVVSENSKTYKTIKNCQTVIAPALERLVHNIFAIAILYDVEFDGEKVASWFEDGSLAGQYECKIAWDDGVIQDRSANINEGIMLVNSGLMSKKTFLVKALGLTDEMATAELQRMSEEGQIDELAIDRFNVGGVE